MESIGLSGSSNFTFLDSQLLGTQETPGEDSFGSNLALSSSSCVRGAPMVTKVCHHALGSRSAFGLKRGGRCPLAVVGAGQNRAVDSEEVGTRELGAPQTSAPGYE